MGDSSALSEPERELLLALNQAGVRYIVVGLSASLLQGANTSTQDIDLWFDDVADPRLEEAVRRTGNIWVSGSFGLGPPQIGGHAIGDKFDVVTHMHGLDAFDAEYAGTLVMDVDGVPLHVLPLERIIASKRAAGRPKDLAALPALEEALAALSDKDQG